MHNRPALSLQNRQENAGKKIELTLWDYSVNESVFSHRQVKSKARTMGVSVACVYKENVSPVLIKTQY